MARRKAPLSSRAQTRQQPLEQGLIAPPPRRAVGRPRLYPTHAARQQAYRTRKRHASQRTRKVYHRSQTGEWETPQDFFARLDAEFGFTLDVAAQPGNAKCPRYFTPTEDGLAQRWDGVCWLNPPYGPTIPQWLGKAVHSVQAGATVVCLLPARTDTRWWHTWVEPWGEVRYVPGRLKFSGAQANAPFPSAIVIFRPPRDRHPGPAGQEPD